MQNNVRIGSFGRELVKAVRQFEERGGNISSVELVGERFAINSRLNSIVQLLCDQHPERAKAIRMQARDLVGWLVDAYTEQLLSSVALEFQAMDSIYDRAILCVTATQAGSPLTLLEIVRCLTGQSMPFSAAKNCDWMTQDMANMFSELMFVRVSWLLTGEGHPSIPMPLNYELPTLTTNKLGDVDVLKRELFVITKNSVLEHDCLLVQRLTIKNSTLPHSMPLQVFRPLLRTGNLSKVAGAIESGAKDMSVVLHGDIGAMEYESLVAGCEVYSSFISKVSFQLSTKESIESILGGGCGA